MGNIHRRIIAVLVALPGAQGLAQEQSLPELKEVTARDLYVGCSMVVTDNDLAEPRLLGEFKKQSPVVCLIWEMKALALANEKDADPAVRFCPQTSLEFQAGPPKQMALAYLNFFEKNGKNVADKNGLAVMILSFRDKWPCEQ